LRDDNSGRSTLLSPWKDGMNVGGCDEKKAPRRVAFYWSLSVNFSADELAIVCPAYDVFVGILRKLEKREGWSVEQVDTGTIPIALRLADERQRAEDGIQLRSDYLVRLHHSLCILYL